MSSDNQTENPVRRNRERLAKFYGGEAVDADPVPQRHENLR